MELGKAVSAKQLGLNRTQFKQMERAKPHQPVTYLKKSAIRNLVT